MPTAAPAIRALDDSETAALGVLARIDRRSRLNRGDAAKIADDAARIAQRWPNHAPVEAIFARAAVAAGRDTVAIAAADRALASSPDNVTALIAKARAQIRLASAAPRSANWAGIRALVLRANTIDTENAEPLMVYYQSFAAAGEAPTANAVKALLYARVLIPQDDELRLLAARQQVVDGKFADALATLAPLAYDPHGKNRELSAKAVTAVAVSDRAASLAAIDELMRKLKDPRGRG